MALDADPVWIDTHCHLDASEFDADRAAVVRRARQAGVEQIVLPAVMPASFDATRREAHCHGLAYAIGTHPLYLPTLQDDPVEALDRHLARWASDPRLVAVGEIGLDFFVPALCEPAMRQRQEQVFQAQLQVAAQRGWPVLLHVRRSADRLLKGLRACRAQGRPVPGGIAHAFNGSEQQARAFLDLGFCLGFGGTLTFERALQIRRLARQLPLDGLVLETDAPDIPPSWLYATAARRAQGATSRNEPAELPRIAQELAALRGIEPAELARVTGANARRVLPRLATLPSGGIHPDAAPVRSPTSAVSDLRP